MTPGDIIDQATAVTDLMREIGLQQRKPEGPRETGACLHCEEPVPAGRRWCDAECRDQWQKDQR